MIFFWFTFYHFMYSWDLISDSKGNEIHFCFKFLTFLKLYTAVKSLKVFSMYIFLSLEALNSVLLAYILFLIRIKDLLEYQISSNIDNDVHMNYALNVSTAICRRMYMINSNIVNVVSHKFAASHRKSSTIAQKPTMCCTDT